jgi:hypothetical protein
MSAAAAPLPRPVPTFDTRSDGAAQRRPKLLLDAARHGLADYRASRDLPRLIGAHVPSTSVVSRLTALEAEMEAARVAGDPAWSDEGVGHRRLFCAT